MEKIRQMIETRQYANAKSSSNWGGANVVISDKETDEIRRWKSEDLAHIAVITRNTPALIWLVEQLKPIAKVDFMTKFEYYAAIAKAANSFVADNDNDTQGLLLSVLDSVKAYL